MKVVGLVVEYNPFHNGHLYHLQQAKKISGADAVICVMSGNYTQRGEPAIIHKWARAKTALLSGVDLVIELPTVYAMSSAESFAQGAITLLDSTRIVDHVCFGSESGDIASLSMIAKTLNEEPENYRVLLKEALAKGVSFPVARASAYNDYSRQIGQPPFQAEQILSTPNNILGIEYLKALKRLNSTILPLTLSRIENNYHQEDLTGTISSATAIRKKLTQNPEQFCGDLVQNPLPSSSICSLKEEFENGRGPITPQIYTDLLLSMIRKTPEQQLKEFAYVSEGLEYRIKRAANNSGTWESLMDEISTKRYPRTRIQRSLFSMLCDIRTSDIAAFNQYGGPQYIRVLGFNQKGISLLSQMNKKATLPVIIKTADFKNSCNPLLRRMLEIEALCTDLYVLGYANSHHKKSGQEFTQNVVRV